MKKTELGTIGEKRAAEWLEGKGYQILERNFRCRLGEVDIIAEKGKILAFVEVKLRKNAAYGAAREFVTPAKQQKLRLTASYYLAGHSEKQQLQPRFDVIEIYAPQGAEGSMTVAHLENAFE